MNKKNIKIILAFGAIYIIWGSTYLATRFAIEAIPPLLMVGTRSLTAGIILYFLSRKMTNEKLKYDNLLPLFLLGAMFFLVGHGLLAWAQQYVPSGIAALLVTPEPLLIFGLEWFFLKDTRIKLKGILGLLLGLIGVVFLIVSTSSAADSNNDLLASILIILGTISWGGGAVYSRTANIPKSPMLSSGMELIFGGLLVLAVGFITGETSQFHFDQVTLKSFLGLLYLIIFGSVIAFGSYVWLLKQTSATRISTHTFVNPVIAVLLGWLFANEQITFELLAAAVVIIISVYLVLYEQLVKRKNIKLEIKE